MIAAESFSPSRRGPGRTALAREVLVEPRDVETPGVDLESPDYLAAARVASSTARWTPSIDEVLHRGL
jgi:hypothetical protein